VRVVLLGPPGVGKGTQGRRLATDMKLALISTGEMLRDAISRNTPLGLEARGLIDSGLLVSDDVMIGLVQGRTLEQDAQAGFVLDGFPRTVPQATALDRLLAAQSRPLNAVVLLDAPTTELVTRVSARRECPVCKRAYNMVSAPPRDGKHCDDHPTVALIQRADDAEGTVRKRLDIYQAQTAPLVGHYREQGRLIEVSGLGDMNDVYAALKLALEEPGVAR